MKEQASLHINNDENLKSPCSTVYTGYKGHAYKGQLVIRDILAGTKSFPFILA